MSGFSTSPGAAAVTSVNGLTGAVVYQAGMHNRAINPSGQIQQTAIGSQADGTADFDQWYVLTESNAVTSSVQNNVEDTTPYMMRITQANAAAQRFGRIQHIEKENCIDLRSQTVTLSARVRMSASTTLRYAIIEWTGTADSPTKDVVNNWASATFTTGNFFISTTTTITATGSTALTANTLTTVSLSGTIGSSANNVAVFFWTDSTQAQNVTLDIGKVQLEVGSVATPLARRSFGDDLRLCQRYCCKTYDQGVLPAAVTNAGIIGGQAPGTVASRPFVSWSFPVVMNRVPTVTYYSPVTGTFGQLANLNTSADVAANSYVIGMASLTFFPTGTPAVGEAIIAHIVALARV